MTEWANHPLQKWQAAGKPWPWSTLQRPPPGDPIDRMLDDMLELDLIDRARGLTTIGE